MAAFAAAPDSPDVTCDGTWHVVKTPHSQTHDTHLYGVTAVSGNDAWAVGVDNPESGVAPYTKVRTEHWDGAAWTVVPAPIPQGTEQAGLNAVSAVSASNVWAVGQWQDLNSGSWQILIEHWNGTAWKLVPSGLLGTGVNALGVDAISASNVWLVGTTFPGAPSNPFTAHWNGTSWKAVSAPRQPGSADNWLRSVSGSAHGDVWAVGNYTDSSWSYGLIEHWNGTAWSIVTSQPAFLLNGVASISTNDAWAVGTDPAGGAVLTEHWNGTKWKAIAAPPGTDATVGGVSAASTDDVWLVGTTFPSSIRKVLTEHWDGSAWTTVLSQTPAEVALSVDGVSVAPGGAEAFAVGTYLKTETGYGQTLAEIYC